VAEVKKKPEAMTNDVLVTRLEQMNRQAIGHMSDEVSSSQDDNLERYLGMPYGDEEEGRSSAISMDVAEVVDWAVPDILEPFISGDKVVEFRPTNRKQEAYCENATDLVNYAFYNENDGTTFLHDIVKTGSIQKIGFSKTVWQEEDEQHRETLTGISQAHLAELQADKSLEIEEVTSEPMSGQIADEQAAAAFSDGMVYTATIVSTKKTGCNKLMALPPEQVKFSARSSEIKDVDYICHEIETSRSKLLEMGFDADDVDRIPTDGKTSSDLSRDNTRFHDESRRESSGTQHAADSLLLIEEYPLIDANGDGRLERLQVFRVGKVVLQKEEVDEHPFDSWSPDRIPHRLVGLALADKVKQTAYIKTHLTRQLLDNVYLANNPRIEVPADALGPDTVADLLTYRVGGLIRTKGQGQMLRPIEIPDRSGTAMQAIMYMDGVREQQSGITKNGMAVSSEVIDPKSATEARQQDRNEQVRKRLMIRMLAQTFLVPVFRKMLKNVVRYQDVEKEIQVRGKWVAIDPRGWDADLKARVAVGLGHANREEMMQGANIIGQAQLAAAEHGLIEPKHIFKIGSKIVEAAGMGYGEDYFTDPSSEEGQQALAAKQQAQQQDPKMIEAQGKLQLKQAEGQMSAQMKQQEIAHKAQMAQVQAEADFKIAQMKAQMEYNLGIQQIQVETQLSREQMSAEMSLAEWEAGQNIKLKEKQIAATPKKTANGSGNASSVRFGGHVG
jgi:hypothetical protein